MKKLIVLSAAVMMLAASVNAQNETAKTTVKKEIRSEKKDMKMERKALRKLEGKEVSFQAKLQFQNDFNNAPILASKRSGIFDEFSFTKDGRATWAYYDAGAHLVGTTQNRTLADLPAKARNEINKMYKNYTIGEVLFFDDNQANETDMFLYGNQFEDEDSYFVELIKDSNNKIVVHVKMNGQVGYFTKLR